MLRIRFQRIGKKNQPFFRLVVVDRNSPPQGGRFEKLGWLNPLTKERGLEAERVKYWLSVGAQPTDRVYNWLIDEGILSVKKKAVHARKKSQPEEPVTASEAVAPEGQEKKEKTVEKKEKTVEKKEKTVKKEKTAEKKEKTAEKKEEAVKQGEEATAVSSEKKKEA